MTQVKLKPSQVANLLLQPSQAKPSNKGAPCDGIEGRFAYCEIFFLQLRQKRGLKKLAFI